MQAHTHARNLSRARTRTASSPPSFSSLGSRQALAALPRAEQSDGRSSLMGDTLSLSWRECVPSPDGWSGPSQSAKGPLPEADLDPLGSRPAEEAVHGPLARNAAAWSRHGERVYGGERGHSIGLSSSLIRHPLFFPSSTHPPAHPFHTPFLPPALPPLALSMQRAVTCR
jgi:hypothetical protein